jgi:D-alanyl-D-alanine carboxypeptidase
MQIKYRRLAALAVLILCGCRAGKAAAGPADSFLQFVDMLDDTELKNKILEDTKEFKRLARAMFKDEEQDAMLFVLADKQHFLDKTYAPADLVSLDTLEWAVVNRSGLELRAVVIESLQAMSLQAQKEGVTLLISSCYRSYAYQEAVYARWVRELGQTEADRVSARPGSSQHQLGTVIDFGSINQSFNNTKAQIWLASHAALYGWSLSYPQGYEKETGYTYESWHYRYIGAAAAAMQEKFFDNLQYKLLQFWNDHKNELNTII